MVARSKKNSIKKNVSKISGISKKLRFAPTPMRHSKHAEEQGMKIFLVAVLSIALIVVLSLFLFYQDDAVAGQAVAIMSGDVPSCAGLEGELCFVYDGSFFNVLEGQEGDSFTVTVVGYTVNEVYSTNFQIYYPADLELDIETGLISTQNWDVSEVNTTSSDSSLNNLLDYSAATSTNLHSGSGNIEGIELLELTFTLAEGVNPGEQFIFGFDTPTSDGSSVGFFQLDGTTNLVNYFTAVVQVVADPITISIMADATTTFAEGDSGNIEVGVEASGGSGTLSMTLDIQQSGVSTLDGGGLLEEDVEITDDGGNLVTPLINNGDGTWSLSASKGYFDEGSYELIFTVTDEVSSSESVTLDLEVTAAAETAAPVVTLINDLSEESSSETAGDELTSTIVVGDSGVLIINVESTDSDTSLSELSLEVDLYLDGSYDQTYTEGVIDANEDGTDDLELTSLGDGEWYLEIYDVSIIPEGSYEFQFQVSDGTSTTSESYYFEVSDGTGMSGYPCMGMAEGECAEGYSCVAMVCTADASSNTAPEITLINGLNPDDYGSYISLDDQVLGTELSLEILAADVDGDSLTMSLDVWSYSRVAVYADDQTSSRVTEVPGGWTWTGNLPIDYGIGAYVIDIAVYDGLEGVDDLALTFDVVDSTAGSTGTGVEGSICASDGDCSTGFRCETGVMQCVADSGSLYCESDVDCSAGYLCSTDVNECYEDSGTVCTSDLECSPYTCSSLGTCGTGCITNAECYSGYACSVSGACELDSDSDGVVDSEEGTGTGDVGDACSLDADCLAGYACSEGICADPAAVGTGVGGDSCALDVDCSEGFSCDLTTLECVSDGSGVSTTLESDQISVSVSKEGSGISVADFTEDVVYDIEVTVSPTSDLPEHLLIVSVADSAGVVQSLIYQSMDALVAGTTETQSLSYTASSTEAHTVTVFVWNDWADAGTSTSLIDSYEVSS